MKNSRRDENITRLRVLSLDGSSLLAQEFGDDIRLHGLCDRVFPLRGDGFDLRDSKRRQFCFRVLMELIACPAIAQVVLKVTFTAPLGFSSPLSNRL